MYEHAGCSESLSRMTKACDSGFEAMNLGTTLYWMRKHFSNYTESRLFLTGFMTNKVHYMGGIFLLSLTSRIAYTTQFVDKSVVNG